MNTLDQELNRSLSQAEIDAGVRRGRRERSKAVTAALRGLWGAPASLASNVAERSAATRSGCNQKA